ncbi:hypothetical protein ECANGB1_2758 [Enterospora canceri]|uniref:Uncharacterized protein n=1 Tax=Enterospora canceri TaxID=1081671 RepID=A0A1Y1S4P3_9MICR|nr:hypothetical protein ECANGB1_2758 [Enterospora canceri]
MFLCILALKIVLAQLFTPLYNHKQRHNRQRGYCVLFSVYFGI